MAQPNASEAKLADSTDNPQIGEQGAAITASPAIAAYSAHASGAVAVTSNGATDLDTTAAALEALRDEVALITTAVNACVSALEAQGLIADN
jgi:hypothetical protein